MSPASAIGCPHESQNFCPLSLGVPHFGQEVVWASGAAHSLQNFAAARLSWPQLGHFILCRTSRQRVEQRLGVLQIRRVEPLGEPAVDLAEHPPRLVLSALLVEEAGKARRRSELERLR